MSCFLEKLGYGLWWDRGDCLREGRILLGEVCRELTEVEGVSINLKELFKIEGDR